MLSISNILIIISIFFTFVANYLYRDFMSYWMNSFFLHNWDYITYILQYFTYSFIHWWVLHILFNSVFIYYFWNMLEYIIWQKKYIIFFIFVTIFNWVALTLLTNANTIWISWFAMAILAYYTLELKERRDPEYKWWITAIVINVWIGLSPEISLVWHLFWAIAWVIFFYLNKDYLRRLMQPLKKESAEEI